jgi:hypothetical protein
MLFLGDIYERELKLIQPKARFSTDAIKQASKDFLELFERKIRKFARFLLHDGKF